MSQQNGSKCILGRQVHGGQDVGIYSLSKTSQAGQGAKRLGCNRGSQCSQEQSGLLSFQVNLTRLHTRPVSILDVGQLYLHLSKTGFCFTLVTTYPPRKEFMTVFVFLIHILKSWWWLGIVALAFNPSIQDRASSRTVGTTQWDPVSKPNRTHQQQSEWF